MPGHAGLKALAQLANDAARQHLVDLGMPRNGLGNLGLGILISVVLAAVADEHRAGFLNLADQVAPFHTSSSWA